jgi:hypothetical protein
MHDLSPCTIWRSRPVRLYRTWVRYFVIIACCLAGPSTWRSCQVKLRLMPEEEGAGTGRLVALALVAGVVAFATFAIFSLVSSSIAKGGEL